MPLLTGRKGRRIPSIRSSSLGRKISELFDPTVTMINIVNDGSVFGAFAVWCAAAARAPARCRCR
jgi:hypothetical protein